MPDACGRPVILDRHSITLLGMRSRRNLPTPQQRVRLVRQLIFRDLTQQRLQGLGFRGSRRFDFEFEAWHLLAAYALSTGLWGVLLDLVLSQRLSLEAVGAARRAGVTQAALAKQLNLDPRNFFYVIQTLATRKLVREAPFGAEIEHRAWPESPQS